MQLYSPDSSKRNEAVLAVRQAGTNALPNLLKVLEDDDQKKGSEQLFKNIDNRPFFLLSKKERKQVAISAFQILGPEARPAIPVLIRLLPANDDSLIEGTPVFAARALAGIGPGSVEYLMRELSFFQEIGTDEASTLVRHLHDEDRMTRACAALALGAFNGDPGIVQGPLMNAATDPDSIVRTNALMSLERLQKFRDGKVYGKDESDTP